ncbi:MAG TPA: DUF4331 domain-containing protein [Gaiellaceae bacterium]|nr:DUF4331 domain-containing protein [Gaiellaceae bacterium]
MRTAALTALAVAAVLAVAVAAAVRAPAPAPAAASSHREAPLIAEDPAADATDLYAFRSPDRPDTVTILGNWIPAEDPAAGPNWYVFSPRARYGLHVDRTGDGKADVSYYFRFRTKEPVAFLGNTAQTYSVTRVVGSRSTVLASGLQTPPNNIGPRSTPNYRSLAAAGVHDLPGGAKVFAGQRDDAFFGDIGAIFDLVAIRNGTGATGGGKDFFAGYGVHGIALQLPIAELDTPSHVIGVWMTTERQRIAIRQTKGRAKAAAQWVQVARLGNPLVNEVLIPTPLKDRWNALGPDQDAQFARYVREPILASLLNQLYPSLGPFQTTGRDDLVAVLLTGVPNLNNTGTTLADMLRLNLSTPVTAKPNRLGVLGGDVAGWPNGRRLGDDVIDIAERAIAGALIGKSLPLGDGVDANDRTNLSAFPYEPDPRSGFDNSKGVTFPTTG